MIITDITAAIDALDFYDRMYLGQFDEITKAYRYHGKKDYQTFTEQEKILLEIRCKMMPDIANLGFNCSRGIYCPETPKRAVDSHDILQVFNYEYAVNICGIKAGSIDYRTHPVCIDGQFPEVIIDGDEAIMNAEQMAIVYDAAKAYAFMVRGEIRKLFEMFTDDEEVLKTAETVVFPSMGKNFVKKADDFVKSVEKQMRGEISKDESNNNRN